MSSRWLRVLGGMLLSLHGAVVGAVKISPRVTGGFATLVDDHRGLAGSVRIHLTEFLFVEPESLILRAPEHTDRGPLVHAGVMLPARFRARWHLAIGGGPVKSPTGDNGMFCLSLGVRVPLGKDSRAFVLPEGRLGYLGETGFMLGGVSLVLSGADRARAFRGPAPSPA